MVTIRYVTIVAKQDKKRGLLQRIVSKACKSRGSIVDEWISSKKAHMLIWCRRVRCTRWRMAVHLAVGGSG